MESFKRFSMFKLPKFARVDLAPVHELHKLIGSPASKYKTIHVTGTNGKGTVCHKIAKALQLAGFKTGLFISPHLKTFNERISIVGEYIISDDDLVNLQEEVMETYSSLSPRFKQLVVFDIITLIALKYFDQQKVDYAVIEVGIGGIIDSTNIINPEISIITSIGMDHMEILGDTKEKISEQKMGIFKKNTPIVIGPDWPQKYMYEYLTTQMEADDDLIHMVGTKSDDLVEGGMLQTTQYKDFNHENNAVIFKAIELLNRNHEIISSEILQKALEQQIPGRFHKVSETVYYDGCHNSSGIEKSLNMLADKIPKDQKVTIVWAFTRIKNLVDNIEVILNHQYTSKFENIVLCSLPEVDDSVTYEPSWIPVSKLIQTLKDISDSRLKVCTLENGLVSLTDIAENGIDSTQISEDFNHIKTMPFFSENFIFVCGTFRLYSALFSS